MWCQSVCTYTCTHTVSSSMLELTCILSLLQVLVPTTLDNFFFPHHQQPSILSSQLSCLPITTLASSQAHHPPLITHHPLPVTHHPPPIGREVNLSSSRLSGASFGSLRLGSPCECVCVCVCVLYSLHVSCSFVWLPNAALFLTRCLQQLCQPQACVITATCMYMCCDIGNMHVNVLHV